MRQIWCLLYHCSTLCRYRATFDHVITGPDRIIKYIDNNFMMSCILLYVSLFSIFLCLFTHCVVSIPWCDWPATSRDKHAAWTLLLTWTNLNPSMNKWLYPLKCVGWNYLSIPKPQRCNRWRLRMEKKFHPTLYLACDYLSVPGLKVMHVSKSGPCGLEFLELNSFHLILNKCNSC